MIAVSHAFAVAEKFDDATKVALDIKTAYGDERAFAQLALVLARTGELEVSSSYVNTLDSEILKSDTISKISLIMVANGHVDQALASVSKIPQRYRYLEAVKDILSVVTQNGHADLAKKLAGDIFEFEDYVNMLIEIAGDQARSGDAIGAIVTARQIKDPMSRSIALASIAEIFN